MKRVVMTGSTGDIGACIKDTLKQNNIDVIELALDLSTDFTTCIDNVDGFIHCAGVNYLKESIDINDAEYNKLFSINTYSFIKLCGQLKFNDGANIIAIGSIYASYTKEKRIQYSMSKHALLSAVKTMALEFSDRKIKFNMISPGFVDTKMTRKNNTKNRIEKLNKYIPLGLVDKQDIANLSVFLIEKNNSITGQNLIIDGGYTCKLF